MLITENALQYGLNLRGKVCYSMSNRLGVRSMDCSSFVFRALITAGFLPKDSFIGNTETLFKLNGKLLEEISRSEVRRGNLWIAGHEGASLGSAGHTGLFLSDIHGDALHCTYSKGCQNIAVTKAIGWMGDYSGLPVRYFRVKNTSVTGPSESAAQQRILAIDGSWGSATTRRLQEVLNCTIKDGIISGQIENPANQAIPSVQFGNGGSNVIRRLQALLSVPSDGNFEPATCLALQKRMGTIQDGIISPVSDCVKAMQRRLNEGFV
ncbi:peptidoglycan amidohydrolase family protein [Enterococcus sp.]|uniref:C40 family peptidase n=1 Tax=Enterococcus sp. TaxID=35783 RepID=UPI0029083E86|nr:peptidoglycan amidohydrolase family protein [Enterococcus sp.]MDU5334999.1 peptidoglycan amidohydrolase family protein [Enterococcus sp.]